MEIYILDSRILDILIMSLAFCFIIRCFESALCFVQNIIINNKLRGVYNIIYTITKNIFPATNWLPPDCNREDRDLPANIVIIIIYSVSEHIICLVDNLAVQEDVEPLRQRAVRGGGLVPHVVHQERPGQLLRSQQLPCSVAVSASERTLCANQTTRPLWS